MKSGQIQFSVSVPFLVYFVIFCIPVIIGGVYAVVTLVWTYFMSRMMVYTHRNNLGAIYNNYARAAYQTKMLSKISKYCGIIGLPASFLFSLYMLLSWVMENLDDHRGYLLAVGLPVVLLCSVSLGLYFASIGLNELFTRYVAYFSEYKNVFTVEQDYEFSKAKGRKA